MLHWHVPLSVENMSEYLKGMEHDKLTYLKLHKCPGEALLLILFDLNMTRAIDGKCCLQVFSQFLCCNLRGKTKVRHLALSSPREKNILTFQQRYMHLEGISPGHSLLMAPLAGDPHDEDTCSRNQVP
jgi:hypothetical protein